MLGPAGLTSKTPSRRVISTRLVAWRLGSGLLMLGITPKMGTTVQTSVRPAEEQSTPPAVAHESLNSFLWTTDC